MYNQIEKGYLNYTSYGLRIWNEVATIILFAVVFLVVLKNAINWIWGVVGIVLVSVLLMMSVRLYKKVRAKKSWDKYEKTLIEKNKEEDDNLS